MKIYKIGEVIGSESSDLLYKEDSSLISNTDGVGIEVEIENCLYDGLRGSPTLPIKERFIHEGNKELLPSLKTFWRVIKDGSLRDGTEFIFNGPLIGANIISALTQLDELFKVYVNPRNGRGVVSSDRCSVHVHLDVRRLSDAELTNLILVYLLFERFIFLSLDPSRIKNSYCRPLTDSSFKYILSDLLNVSNGEDRLIRILQAVTRQCDKYSALNILPVTSKGSIEFRHHQGTTKPLELVNWINIIFALKKASGEYSVSYLLDFYDKNGFRSLIDLVFHDIPVYNIDIHSDLDINHIINSGANDVKEIIYMGALSKRDQTSKSRARPVNTLLYKYKMKHKLLEKK